MSLCREILKLNIHFSHFRHLPVKRTSLLQRNSVRSFVGAVLDLIRRGGGEVLFDFRKLSKTFNSIEASNIRTLSVSNIFIV